MFSTSRSTALRQPSMQCQLPNFLLKQLSDVLQVDRDQCLNQNNTGINVLNPLVRLFLVDNLLVFSYSLRGNSFPLGFMIHSISVISLGEPPIKFRLKIALSR